MRRDLDPKSYITDFSYISTLFNLGHFSDILLSVSAFSRIVVTGRVNRLLGHIMLSIILLNRSVGEPVQS